MKHTKLTSICAISLLFWGMEARSMEGGPEEPSGSLGIKPGESHKWPRTVEGEAPDGLNDTPPISPITEAEVRLEQNLSVLAASGIHLTPSLLEGEDKETALKVLKEAAQVTEEGSLLGNAILSVLAWFTKTSVAEAEETPTSVQSSEPEQPLPPVIGSAGESPTVSTQRGEPTSEEDADTTHSTSTQSADMGGWSIYDYLPTIPHWFSSTPASPNIVMTEEGDVVLSEGSYPENKQ